MDGGGGTEVQRGGQLLSDQLQHVTPSQTELRNTLCDISSHITEVQHGCRLTCESQLQHVSVCTLFKGEPLEPLLPHPEPGARGGGANMHHMVPIRVKQLEASGRC